MSNTRSLTVWFFVFGMVVLLVACGDDDKPTPPTPADPVLTASTSILQFAAADTTKTLTLTNSGGDSLSWQASADEFWILIEPDSGTISSTPAIITVRLDRTIVSPGISNGRIFIESNGGDDTILVSAETIIPFGSVYFPMTDGDIWYYTNDSGRAFIRSVSGDTTVFGAACKIIREDGATVESWSKSDTAFAVHFLTGDTVYAFSPPLLVPFNLFTTPYHYNSLVFIGITSVGSTEGDVSFTNYVTKTVPAGTFASVAQIHYDPAGDDPDDPPYDEFYAPGVGLLDNGNVALDSAFIGGVWYRP